MRVEPTRRPKTYAALRGAQIIARARAGKGFPSAAEKVATCGCVEELSAFRAEVVRQQGALSIDVLRALNERRAEIERGHI